MTEYTDIKNNTYKITHTVILSDDKEHTENKIVEALYKIFMNK